MQPHTNLCNLELSPKQRRNQFLSSKSISLVSYLQRLSASRKHLDNQGLTIRMGSSYGRNTPVDLPSREAYRCQSNEHIKQIAQTSNSEMAGGARFTNHYSTAFILKTSKWVSILTAPWSIHQRENAEPFWEATALSEPGRFSKMRSPSFFYLGNNKQTTPAFDRYKSYLCLNNKNKEMRPPKTLNTKRCRAFTWVGYPYHLHDRKQKHRPGIGIPLTETSSHISASPSMRRSPRGWKRRKCLPHQSMWGVKWWEWNTSSSLSMELLPSGGGWV